MRCLAVLSERADELYERAEAADEDDPVHEELRTVTTLTADIRNALDMKECPP
jgi:hypothetical protein